MSASALPMVRVGDCSRCGGCCFPDPSADAPHLFTQADLDHPERIEGACPMLRRDDERYLCAGYGWHPYYKAGCWSFPSGPGDLAPVPACTYRFEAC